MGLEDEPAFHLMPEEKTPLEGGTDIGFPGPQPCAPMEPTAEPEPLPSYTRWTHPEATLQSHGEEPLEAEAESAWPEPSLEEPSLEEPISRLHTTKHLSANFEPETFVREEAEDGLADRIATANAGFDRRLQGEAVAEGAYAALEGHDVEEDRPADWMAPYLVAAPPEQDEAEKLEATSAAPTKMESSQETFESFSRHGAEGLAEAPRKLASSPKSWKTEAFTPAPVPSAKREREIPLASFRHTDTPLSVAAAPSLSTPMPLEVQAQEEGSRLNSPHRSQRWEPETPSVQVRETTVLPQRPGLARAVAQAAAEEGPPARASEGLTAMRTGAGLRKALVRQEAVLRSQPQEPTSSRAQPGMSRRWAMLSQFERAEKSADKSANAEQRFSPAAERSAPPESARNSGV